MDAILDIERNIVEYLGWPLWSCRSIELLSLIFGVLSLIQLLVGSLNHDKTATIESTKINHNINAKFRIFQGEYLIVFLTVMLADWLQGTNMYTLYASYKVDIGTLFLTGFLSSAIFGTFLGVYVDRWGRKFGCLLFCVLEIVINLLEHIPSMPILLAGRVLGGLSTSLLFSAFESWMVSEHRKRGFSEDLLASTFAISSWANGFIAIFAGVLAQFASDVNGDIGPFQVAIILTVISMVFILPWQENYGAHSSEADAESKEQVSFVKSVQGSLNIMAKNPSILCLGLSQAFFEGGVYTFVFMWVPSMISVVDGPLPTGLVFSSLMLSMTIGGMLFSLLLPIFPGGAEGLSIIIYFVAALAMAIPIVKFSFHWIFPSFIVLEGLVGMFNSCGGILRSKYYPEGQQSSIMSVFRLPLNLLVVTGTYLTNNAGDIQSLRIVFIVVTCMHSIAMLLQIYLHILNSNASASTSKSEKLE